jgi:UPF0271 protein
VASIDLNSDLGEGYGIWQLGDDEALLSVVSSANVACGFHAGDPGIMRRVCARAVADGVSIGAQVSYPDRDGFGRRFIDMAPGDLADAVVYQIGALQACATVSGGAVRYVKPHGALYNAVVHHEVQARAVVDGVRALSAGLAVMCLPGSALLRAADAAGLPTVAEGFLDRGYRADGTLVPRTEPGALLTDPDTIAARAVALVETGHLDAVDGSRLRLTVASLCLHGDTPGAVAAATRVRAALLAAGHTVAPPAAWA